MNLFFFSRTFLTKIFQGLGTSSANEAREYFSNLDKHQIEFNETSKEDLEAIELAFDKKKADERKEWMKNHEVNFWVFLKQSN